MTVSTRPVFVFRGVLMAASLLVAAQGVLASSAFSVPTGERQLFLDDSGIAQIKHLKRTMHQPAKKGTVIRPDYHGFEKSVQTRCAPVWDPEEKVYKIWYLVSGMKSYGTHTCYAESRDGLHWYKPILRQKEINGSLENNVVTIDPKLEWKKNHISNVVYDPTDPDPSRRYKGISRCPGRELLVSPNGIDWRWLEVPPVYASEEAGLSFDEKTHRFIATFKRGGYDVRSHRLLTSTDFEHWTDPDQGVRFRADKVDHELNRKAITAQMAELVADPRLAQTDFYHEGNYTVDIYHTSVFRYESYYLAMLAMHPSRTMDLADPSDNIAFKVASMMCSRDLLTWTWVGDRQNFIGLSPPESGAHDICQAFPPANAVVRGDELWFYYTGIADIGWPPKTGINAAKKDWKHYRPDKGGICLAVLRRDGFVSLDAGQTEGTVVTKAFTLPGETLLVNVDAYQGEMRIDVLDADSHVIAQSDPLTGDLQREPVKWAKGDITELKGQTVSLRFNLRNAQFYSYWLR